MSKPNPIVQINRLYNKGIEALAREMQRLNEETKLDKLSERHSRDLRDNLKLLKELKVAQLAIEEEARRVEREKTKRITDYELAKLVKEPVNG